MTSEPGAGRPRLRVCHVAATTEGATLGVRAASRPARPPRLRRLRHIERRQRWPCRQIQGCGGSRSMPRISISPRVQTSCGCLTGSWHLYRLLRRERFDVVQTHLFQSMVLGRIAAWFADVPVRLSMIAGPFHLEAYTPRWIDRWTCWLDTAIIASCEYTRLLYRKIGVPEPQARGDLLRARRAQIRSNGDKSRRSSRTRFGWPSDTPLVGMVAYFYQELPKSRLVAAGIVRTFRQESGGFDPCRRRSSSINFRARRSC